VGHLFTSRGTKLEVTTEDALWLARAIEAEGDPRVQVGQTLINRWAWLWDLQPGLYPTLTSLIRAYAQPVNEAWFPGGALLEKWFREHPNADRAAALERAAKRRDVHSTRDTFSEQTRRAVSQALYGPVVIPPGAVHFGDAVNGQNQIIVSAEAKGALYRPLQVGELEHGSARMLDVKHGAWGFALLGLGGAVVFGMKHHVKRRRKR
jgi:hypothetical protein